MFEAKILKKKCMIAECLLKHIGAVNQWRSSIAHVRFHGVWGTAGWKGLNISPFSRGCSRKEVEPVYVPRQPNIQAERWQVSQGHFLSSKKIITSRWRSTRQRVLVRRNRRNCVTSSTKPRLLTPCMLEMRRYI